MAQVFNINGTEISYTVEFREGEVRLTTHAPSLGLDLIGALDLKGARELVRQLNTAIGAAAAITIEGERHGKAN